MARHASSNAAHARSHAFSPSRLERFDAVMRRYIDEGHLPGIVTLLDRHGETHASAAGTFELGRGAPMQRDTIFRLASMTKPITAVAAMILVEECTLRLDEPVERWLPELHDRRVLRSPVSTIDDTVPAQRPITLRDLLTFRSGYGESAPGSPIFEAMRTAKLPLVVWPVVATPDEFMQRVATLPLAFQPGERWAYHLSGEILGVLVARASGRSLRTFMRERIFEPLGMTDTDFFVPESKLARLPPCYLVNPFTGATQVHDEVRGFYSRPPAFEAGAGGLASTADDMLVFGQMLLNGGVHGRERILARATVDVMTRDHLSPEQKAVSPFFPNFWDGAGWGLGMGVITNRRDVGRSAGTFGWDGAFSTSLWVDPKEGLVGVMMTQCTPAVVDIPNVVRDFWTAAYAAIEG